MTEPVPADPSPGFSPAPTGACPYRAGHVPAGCARSVPGPGGSVQPCLRSPVMLCPPEGLGFSTSTMLDMHVLSAPPGLVSRLPHLPLARAIRPRQRDTSPEARPPTLPDEHGAQDKDDEPHDARCIPPVSLVALGACQDCPVAQVGQQVRVAFLV